MLIVDIFITRPPCSPDKMAHDYTNQSLRHGGTEIAFSLHKVNLTILDNIMRKLATLLGCFTLIAATPALAGSISIDLNTPDSRNGVFNSTYAMQYNYSEGDLNLAVTGWSYGIKTIQTCNKYNKAGQCTGYKTTTSLKQEIEQDYVGKWDGLGVEKIDSPNHAVDNEGGDFDMHLLSFDQMVILNSLDMGWISNDSDVTVLAYTGPDFNSASLLGKKWQDLLGMGWSLVGNYYNVDYKPNSGDVNAGKVVAQHWLVGAYNDVFGGFTGDNINKTTGNDYYKLKGITVEKPPVVEVPEPGALLLLALGLIGLGARRR